MKFYKKKGFTLLEVLFGIVILSFSFSAVFLFLNNMMKMVSNTKEVVISIEYNPLLFTQKSPFIDENYQNNNETEKINILKYKKEPVVIEMIKNIYLLKKKEDDGKKIYGNFVFKNPEKKNEHEKE